MWLTLVLPVKAQSLRELRLFAIRSFEDGTYHALQVLSEGSHDLNDEREGNKGSQDLCFEIEIEVEYKEL